METYGSNLYEKVQLWLSEVFMGFFMIPDNGIWNYNFIGLKIEHNALYNYILSAPKDFYNEVHRPSHFINFNKMDEDAEEAVNDDMLDLFD